MRNLRLYKTDNEFKTYEQFCGGDGTSTESVVPGVSMSKDLRKRYFNPKDEIALAHIITVNFKDGEGNTLAPSITKRFRYIPGVVSEVVLVPINIDGFTPTEVSKTVQIPETSTVNFTYNQEQ